MLFTRRNLLKSFTLASLQVASWRTFSDTLKEIGLKDAFADDFFIGAMVPVERILRPDAKYFQLIEKHYDALVTDNAFKWQFIHPAENKWDWQYADNFVDFGLKREKKLLGHLLMWHAQLPMGFFDGHRQKPITKTELTRRYEEHISTIVDRYRGKFYSWDVVNEALTKTGWRKTQWLEHLGPEYIDNSFRLVRSIDPSVKLVYNDFGLSSAQKRENVLKLLTHLKDSKTPIDVVGMQGHIGLDYPNLEEMEKSITAFYKAGCKVHISELDVDVLPYVTLDDGISEDEYDPYKDALPIGVALKLAERYKRIFEMFLRHREKIDVVCFWGISDEDSWKNDSPIVGRTNHPLLFDRQLEKKAAFHAVMSLKK